MTFGNGGAAALQVERKGTGPSPSFRSRARSPACSLSARTGCPGWRATWNGQSRLPGRTPPIRPFSACPSRPAQARLNWPTGPTASTGDWPSAQRHGRSFSSLCAINWPPLPGMPGAARGTPQRNCPRPPVQPPAMPASQTSRIPDPVEDKRAGLNNIHTSTQRANGDEEDLRETSPPSWLDLISNRQRQRAAILAAILTGFALRIFRLDFQELRGDETFGYFFSLQPFHAIVEQTLALSEPHPVGSYFLQHPLVSGCRRQRVRPARHGPRWPEPPAHPAYFPSGQAASARRRRRPDRQPADGGQRLRNLAQPGRPHVHSEPRAHLGRHRTGAASDRAARKLARTGRIRRLRRRRHPRPLLRRLCPARPEPVRPDRGPDGSDPSSVFPFRSRRSAKTQNPRMQFGSAGRWPRSRRPPSPPPGSSPPGRPWPATTATAISPEFGAMLWRSLGVFALGETRSPSYLAVRRRSFGGCRDRRAGILSGIHGAGGAAGQGAAARTGPQAAGAPPRTAPGRPSTHTDQACSSCSTCSFPCSQPGSAHASAPSSTKRYLIAALPPFLLLLAIGAARNRRSRRRVAGLEMEMLGGRSRGRRI